jgi:membrane protein DedA with SNARE-associated domain
VLAIAHPLWIAAAAQLALRLQHHVRGPRTGYLGLALASAASWIGLPGPGEAALVTAGIFAAHHRLDLVSVIASGWVGATLGGSGGWLVGRMAGRHVVTAPGPLLRLRRSAVARGDRMYARYGVLAVFFSPSWAAGMVGMRAVPFLLANAASALVWALTLGAGSYVAGPIVLDLVGDAGLIGLIVIAAVVVGGAIFEARRRWRRPRRR